MMYNSVTRVCTSSETIKSSRKGRQGSGLSECLYLECKDLMNRNRKLKTGDEFEFRDAV